MIVGLLWLKTHETFTPFILRNMLHPCITACNVISVEDIQLKSSIRRCVSPDPEIPINRLPLRAQTYEHIPTDVTGATLENWATLLFQNFKIQVVWGKSEQVWTGTREGVPMRVGEGDQVESPSDKHTDRYNWKHYLPANVVFGR